MYIELKNLPVSALEHFNGGEKTFFANMYIDEAARILLGRLEPGASIGLHTHETSSEIIYFLTGSGKAVCDGVEERVAPGGCHYCPKGHAHTLINDGDEDLTFFAVVPQQ